MGEVWQALDLKLRVDVALKRCAPSGSATRRCSSALRGEVRAARDVVSPNVCRIFDLVELDGHELVSMEFVDGTTLARLLRERGPLEPREALEIASQFLAGLEAIHQAGLVHRDVKPDNVMITRAGRVVVMDFGLARPQAERGDADARGDAGLHGAGAAAGDGVDARADIFAAGIVLAEMVGSAGRRRSGREAILRGRGRIRRGCRTARGGRSCCGRWRERREARWASARELMRALEQVALRVDGAEDAAPYPGLASFTEADAEYFFGRELEVEALWQQAGAGAPPGGDRAVRGGEELVPARRAAAGAAGRAGAPWSARRARGRSRRWPTRWPPSSRATPRRSTSCCGSRSRRSRWPPPPLARRHGEALLIVDQFEELFTLNADEVAGAASPSCSAGWRSRPTSTCCSRCATTSWSAATSTRRCADVRGPDAAPAPTGAALRRAIVQPALQCGYRFEDEALVDGDDRRGGAASGARCRCWPSPPRGCGRSGTARGLLTREAYARDRRRGRRARPARGSDPRADRHASTCRSCASSSATWSPRRGRAPCATATSCCRSSASSGPRPRRCCAALIDARLLVEYEERSGRKDAERRAPPGRDHPRVAAARPGRAWCAGRPRTPRGRCCATSCARRPRPGRSTARRGPALDRHRYQEFSALAGALPRRPDRDRGGLRRAMKAERQRRRRRRRIAVTTLVSTSSRRTPVVSALWWREREGETSP